MGEGCLVWKREQEKGAGYNLRAVSKAYTAARTLIKGKYPLGAQIDCCSKEIVLLEQWLCCSVDGGAKGSCFVSL